MFFIKCYHCFHRCPARRVEEDEKKSQLLSLWSKMRHGGYLYLAEAALLVVVLLALTPPATYSVRAFVPVLVLGTKTSPSPPSMLFATDDGKKSGVGGFFEGVGNFFQDLDDFLDDASARRLGNGAGRYSKILHNYSMTPLPLVKKSPVLTHTSNKPDNVRPGWSYHRQLFMERESPNSTVTRTRTAKVNLP